MTDELLATSVSTENATRPATQRGRLDLEAGHRAHFEVLLVLGPVKQGLDHLGVVVDGRRCRLALVRWPLPLGPAVLLPGDVIDEVSDLAPGDRIDSGRPGVLAGVPVKVSQDVGVVVTGFGGEAVAVKEAAADLGEGKGLLFRFGYHSFFSRTWFSAIGLKKSPFLCFIAQF